MKIHHQLLPTALIASSLLTLACSTGTSHKSTKSAARTMHVVAAQASASIGLRQAIGKALSACDGNAVEVEFEADETNSGRTAYEVLIVTKDDRLMEVIIDATTGHVITNEEETGKGVAKEVAYFRKVLGNTSSSLAQFIGAAEARGGVAIEAVLQMEQKNVAKCEVRLLDDQSALEMTLDGKTGSVLETSRETHDDGDDDEGDDDDGDNDDDGDDASK